MKSAAILSLSILLSACTPLEYDILYSQVHIKPIMSPDGKKTFIVNAHNHLPSYEKNKAITEFHKEIIPYEMGKVNYCSNGYIIDYKNPKHAGEYLVYNGGCK